MTLLGDVTKVTFETADARTGHARRPTTMATLLRVLVPGLLVAAGACQRTLDVTGTYTGSGGGSYSVAHTTNNTMSVHQVSTSGEQLVVAAAGTDHVTLQFAGCTLRAVVAGSPDRVATIEPGQSCTMTLADVGAVTIASLGGQATFTEGHVTITLGGQSHPAPGDIGQLTRSFNGNH